MAIDPVIQRKRRRAPKVKTGCGTCKIRRIKCDEAKPNCGRCSTTGRICDGYSSDMKISGKTPESSRDLIQRFPVHMSGNAEEKRGFDFFLRNTAVELSGYYDPSFWGKLVLAASSQKPSLRHAVIALGALHEDFSRKRLGPSTPSDEDQGNQFALNQYAKAMGELRLSLSSGKEEPLTALMSCILFVCFDSLRGWFKSAMVHLESGLRILRDMKSSGKDRLIEDNIAPLLTRLSIQSMIYVETKCAEDKAAFSRRLMDAFGKDVAIPKEFECLEEARNALNHAADGLFGVFYLWDEDLPVVLQPTESLDLLDKYAFQLYRWNLAYERFMTSKARHLTSREVQGAALLKIHHTTAKIIAGLHADTNEMRDVSKVVHTKTFLKCMNDFEIVINLSRPLIAAVEQDTKNGKPSLTFSSDMGLIGPLYYVCINCPSLVLRNTAMELLLRCPRREGMWNSVLVAQMIQQYWDLEARHRQEMGIELDEFGLPARYNDRGAVHFAYFGLSPEMDAMSFSHFSPSPDCPS
ncbi:hypothetical protein BKA65DRAFT_102129 [Rhexocercosporidium sp. MPI-PUGE-AT-0058]|nr:hypothetical protein BKA65DRAFT_102129 [Rhexocercosporidium sp. MPI-PUGE-AT-0058]